MIGIINCTLHCNLACRYCFEENWKEKGISIELINNQFSKSLHKLIEFSKKVIDQDLEDHTEILLHGGEPLLISDENLENLFKPIKEYNYDVQFAVQTNGTLLTKSKIDLFKKYDVKIGISIDGPDFIHDRYRVGKTGNGSHSIIMRNIGGLRDSGLDCGALVTFNAKSLRKIEDVYYFFRDNKINFSFNPFFSPNDSEYSELEFSNEEYSEGICKLFDLWFNDEDIISIPTFEYIMDGITSEKNHASPCNSLKDCSKEIIAIDIDGNLYNCNHFCNDKSFCYGEFTEKTDIKELMANSPFTNRWKELKKGECSTCDVSFLCHGGCQYHAIAKYNDFRRKDFYCSSIRQIITHIYSAIESVLNE